MKAPRILLSLLFSSLLLQAHALIPTDRKQRLTEHWEFIRQDMGSIWEVMRPITGAGKPETVPLWQKVTLPHCFNAEDAVDPDVNYYQGPGWYRTMLNIENPYTNGRTCLEFEGAGQKTEVYVYTEIEIVADFKDNATGKVKALNAELDKLEKRNVNVDITATDRASKAMESINSLPSGLL